MSPEGPDASTVKSLNIHQTAWLVLPTVSLLLGQAAAAAPWPHRPQALAVLFAPPVFFLFLKLRRLSLLLTLAAVAFSLGYLRHRQLMQPVFPPNHLSSFIGADERIYLEGWLFQEPEKLPDRARWRLRCERIWHRTGAEETSGDMLISLRGVNRDWRYGDRVRLWIRPQAPRDSGNPGGFNYAAYLADRGIYVTGYLENDQEVELLGRSAGLVRNGVESLRRQMRRFIEHNFSRDNGALLKGLVVGDMAEISKSIRANFTAAGVNHVLSISGLHVSMLGIVVFALIRFGMGFSSTVLLRVNLLKVATGFSLFAVVFYTALAGAMVPTVRSAIMIGVYEIAVLLDREEEVYNSLALAALLIGLFWPGVIGDISFQLSFLAVLFIVWGMRIIQSRRLRGRRQELPQERSWFKEKFRGSAYHLAVPLFATVGTGPLIAHYFGHLSLAGFIANPIIVPLVGLIVVPLGLLIVFLAVIVPPAAVPLVWLANQFLSLTIWSVEWLARLPLANISVPAPNAIEVAGLYGLILAFMMVPRKPYAVCALVASMAFLTADGFYWWRERWHRRELRITHLNVGQGDAAVVEFPGSKVLLVDAGGAALGDFDTGESIVAPFLRSRKILKVDYLLVSHPRIDHYGGMRAIAAEFSPLEFWSGPARGMTGRFEELEDAVEKQRIKAIPLGGREPCRVIDRVSFCTLYPTSRTSNESSVVLRLEFNGHRFLLSGDIEQRDERQLVTRPAELQSAVIKVPRHGSATASSAEFVAAVKAKLAIVSVGPRRAGKKGRDEVVERYREAGAEILRTDIDGAIILETEGRNIRYRTHKSGRRGMMSFG